MTQTQLQKAFVFPASFAQERLWLLSQMDPDDPAYQIAGALRFKGSLNIPALHASLLEVLRRQDSLRTTFREVNGKVVQVVSPAGPIDFDVVEADQTNPAEQLTSITSRPFDLAMGPLLRVVLLRNAVDDHTLVLVIHHIISDGWSLMVLIREVMEFYRASVTQQTPALPALSIQYPDYTHWQRQLLSTKKFRADLDYWKSQLHNISALDLPADYKRSPVQRHRGSRQRLQLQPYLCTALIELSKREQATLFMVLLSAFKVLLYRLSGAADIAVGTPVAGRKRPELESLIGCFLNTVVLRTELDENKSFRQLLQRVRDVAVAAYSHEDVPFEKVLEETNPKRVLSHTPMFQVLVNMLALPAPLTVNLPGVDVEIVELPETSSKFDLTLYIYAENGRIDLSLVHDADLFSADRIVEMLQQFESLLVQAVAQPDQKVSQFSLVTKYSVFTLPDPVRALDSTWNGAVHELFGRCAERNPEQVALIDPHVSWSYEHVEHLSNRIANFLVREGIRTGDVVAIYAHRSAPLVLALLGVMKTGAAFLILDPAYPPGRLVNYVAAAQPKALLQLEAAGDVPQEIKEWISKAKCRELKLPDSSSGDIDGVLNRVSPDKPVINIGADDLAYVSFTSGSSGAPKGVLGRHGPLTHFAPWMKRAFDLKPSDRFSVFSALSHDPLHRDIFLPLTIGATVVFPEPEKWRSPGNGLRWARENRITVMNLTPAVGQMISEDIGTTAALDDLRLVFFVGDALTRQDISVFQKIAPSASLVNLYGATETQQALSFFPVPLADGEISSRQQDKIVPLGRGFKDVQILVLNRERQLCGVGETGEIHFRSPHLAQGYLNDLKLSREKFVPNWFSGATGDRLYKTGDLGRYLPDGTVEALGRVDTQVKIRGFRVELGEVEAVLKRHSMVRSAVVMLVSSPTENRQLTAYVVLNRESQDWQRHLVEYTAKELPDYMAPKAWMSLERLPLLSNGKVDRKALPAPHDAVARIEYVSPATPIEIGLAAIWADLLKLDAKTISANADFFELGGHSLLAVRLMARIRAQWNVEFEIREVFEATQLSSLANVVQSKGGQVVRPRVAIVHRHAENVPASFAQQRLWLIDQLGGGSARYNMAGAIRVLGKFDEDVAERVFAHIIQRHEPLRTVFRKGEEVPLQWIQPSFDFQLNRIDLCGLSNQAQEHALTEILQTEAAKPFDLSADLMLRASFLRFSENEGVLIFNVHHISSDGWSIGVLEEEFAQLYEAFLQGEPDPLPALAIRYSDYALWQRDWLTSEVLQHQLSYWEKQLSELPDVHSVPLDRPRPMVQTFNGLRHRIQVDQTTLNDLKQFALAEKATLYMVLHGLFSLLLSRHANTSDIVIGTPVANRPQRELEPLVGFFANTLVLRTNCSGGLSFREYLAAVKRTNLEAQAAQDVPFELLVERLKPRRSASYEPLFQIMFSMNASKLREVKLPSLTLAPLQGEHAAARFDLTLEAIEHSDGLRLNFVYNSGLFDELTIVRMSDHFNRLVCSAAANPNEKIEMLSMLAEGEQHHLLRELNQTAVSYPRDKCLHELIEAQVEGSPRATAVSCEDQSLTYEELNRHANRLARYLREHGVKADTLVGLCVERSLEMVVGILGILKAGGAYVPLEPGYPQERLEYMIADSAPAMLVTQARLQERLRSNGVSMVCLDANSNALNTYATSNLERTETALTPDHLAYVIYTSGSTGTPKGAMNAHSGAVNRLLWARDEYELRSDDRILQKTPFSFDVSVWELLLPLLSGAELVMARPGGHMDPQYLAETIEARKITTIHFVPSMLQVFLEHAEAEKCGGLRRVLCSGEALPYALQQRFMSVLPEVELHNLYGPTEAAIDVTSWLCQAEQHEGIVPIGKPIANIQMHVLDRYLQLAPQGVLGELHIGGIGVARGYWNRPEMTAERFIPDPFSAEAGARMYKTGDVGRWLADGAIEYVGRNDHQVKLRGFRIELGEIEQRLMQQAGVQAAVVMVREDEVGEKRLVGYVVPSGYSAGHGEESDRAAITAELIKGYRDGLSKHLPDHMVPAHFVLLGELPLTPNGKLDHKALPAPQDISFTGEYVAPSTETEITLVQIWADLLKTDPQTISATANLFDSGGHSLMLIKLTNEIRNKFSVELSISDVMRCPQLNLLAEQIFEAGLKNALSFSSKYEVGTDEMEITI